MRGFFPEGKFSSTPQASDGGLLSVGFKSREMPMSMFALVTEGSIIATIRLPKASGWFQNRDRALPGANISPLLLYTRPTRTVLRMLLCPLVVSRESIEKAVCESITSVIAWAPLRRLANATRSWYS
jgi:hypothetical protein